MLKSRGKLLVERSHGRRSISRSVLLGTLLLSTLALLGTGASTAVGAHNKSVNMNCTLVVPDQPLTAQGLATPYLLKATDRDNGPCHEANPMQSAFVQAAVVNPATGALAAYNPLVIDKGTKPAIKPVVPNIPAGSVVGIWFGFNGAVLKLQGAEDTTLTDNHCVNGLRGSPFGQFAYCNAVAFFAAANQGVNAGTIVPPALGTDAKGLICPTTRNFFFVDQDQSDNVTTAYLVAENGRLAQDTAANRHALPDAKVLTNASDNRLLVGVDAALRCTPWTRPDLADPGHFIAALPFNELQAAAHQPPPVALVPSDDPMVLVAHGDSFKRSLTKLNLYRVGVDQPQAQSLHDASTKAYCINLMHITPPRLATDAPLLGRGATPDAAVGNTLFTFMAQRYVTTFTGPFGTNLNCAKGFDLKPLVATRQNEDGVAIAVLITVNGEKRCFNSRGIESSLKMCKAHD